MKGLTDKQSETLKRVAKAHLDGGWYRAAGNGERVTLASLHAKGLLDRRVWRKGKSTADNAHEYRLSVALYLGLTKKEAIEE